MLKPIRFVKSCPTCYSDLGTVYAIQRHYRVALLGQLNERDAVRNHVAARYDTEAQKRLVQPSDHRPKLQKVKQQTGEEENPDQAEHDRDQLEQKKVSWERYSKHYFGGVFSDGTVVLTKIEAANPTIRATKYAHQGGKLNTTEMKKTSAGIGKTRIVRHSTYRVVLAKLFYLAGRHRVLEHG